MSFFLAWLGCERTTDVKKEEIVQSAGHLRMLRFLKDCPDDAKLHSTIIYALSQVALLGT